MGDWPQRLLFVPTMTSLHWQPGNLYGGQKEPKYHAVSYTWGRWRLSDKPKIKVKPVVQVDGVEWKILRIDPSHFTDVQLDKVIKQACEIDASVD